MSEPTETQPQLPNLLPRNVRLLGWASFLNDVASEMIYPLMPQFLITVLGGSRFHLGIIEGVADSAASLLKLWSGGWSDRVGSRKGFVVWGYAIATVSRPITGLLTAPWQLFFVRTADRVGKGVRTSPRDALIAESAEADSRGRAFGFQRSMDHLGAAIGPVLATAFLWFWPDSLRVLFVLTFVPGLCVVVMLAFGLSDARRKKRVERLEPRSSTLFSLSLKPFDRNFRLYLLALFIFTLGNSSDAFLLVRAGELGVPTMMLPVLWFVFHLVKSLVSLLAGRIVDRRGAKLPLFAGWLIYAAIYVAFAFATAAWHAWALFLAYGLFHALTEPAEKTLVANLAGPEEQGLAFGWFNFAIGIAALPSSLIFGILYEQYGPLVAFGSGAGLAIVATGLLAAVRVSGRR
ncbi:MAG: MFS transporter [Planctomycetota bacterium]|nr:MAG: MFS transporter [Planctomycetota bacterium]REJ92112.1 MAG: MFS transporter [Planctomycetota bacterium]REK28648.1 MAG: MFS transporter [Planctomycetota bacterium]REK39262.1 MAG: MFS transporter [Planctomycetota bacterium]